MNVARFLPYKSTSDDKIELLTKVFKAAKYLAKKHGMVEWPYATCIELKTCVVKTGLLEEVNGFCTNFTIYSTISKERLFTSGPLKNLM